MPKNLFAVEMHNGNVILVQLKPSLLPRGGDVNRLKVEGDLPANAFDDVQRAVAERAIFFRKECDALHVAVCHWQLARQSVLNSSFALSWGRESLDKQQRACLSMRWMYRHNALSKEARVDSRIVFRESSPTGFVGDDRSHVCLLHNDPDRLGLRSAADGDQYDRGCGCCGYHHSTFHGGFAAARWSLDELGLAIPGLIFPWLDEGLIVLALDDTLKRRS